MNHQVINKKTGAILLSDGFSIKPFMKENSLLNHFGLEKKEHSKWGVHYRLKNIVAGKWYLMFSLRFHDEKLTSLLIYVDEKEFPEVIPPFNRTGYEPSDEEIELFKIYQQWVIDQLGKTGEFVWGKIQVLYRPQQDGPQEPIIYIVYN